MDIIDKGETIEKTLAKKPMRTCTVLLSKGKRKGLPCNRKINTEMDDFCKFHINKAVETNICSVILTKGERKNQSCNRKVVCTIEDETNGTRGLCKIHKTLEDKRPYNPYNEKETHVVVDNDKNELSSLICNLKISQLDVKMVENVRGALT